MWSYARWVAAQCDTLIAPTPPISRRLHDQLGHLPETIRSGVDPTVFTPQAATPAESSALRREFGLDPDRPTILYVGRVDPDKRVEQVVQASARALASTRAQLLIVGDGTRRPAVERLCERLDIARQTCFAGYVRRDGQLPGLYRLASVLVTLSTIETQCLVVLEALLSGVPVVTVDTPVMRELVSDGVNGFLVRPDDLEAVAQRVVLLLENAGLGRKMGQAGRKIAQRYTPDRTLTRHERLYRSVLAGSQDALMGPGCGRAAG
jgi:1,2-diacylglycerol 3-alpha-glucosyltransferase